MSVTNFSLLYTKYIENTTFHFLLIELIFYFRSINEKYTLVLAESTLTHVSLTGRYCTLRGYVSKSMD